MTSTGTSEPTCSTCRYASVKSGTAYVSCEVDLPPFIARWPDYGKQRVHQSYTCALHKPKKEK